MSLATQQRLPPEVNRILYIRNLPFNITPDELYKIFGDYGGIRQIRTCALPSPSVSATALASLISTSVCYILSSRLPIVCAVVVALGWLYSFCMVIAIAASGRRATRLLCTGLHV